MLCTEAVGETEFRASEVFNDYAKRRGIFWGLVSAMAADKHNMCLIGIHRPDGASNFEAEYKPHLDLLLPHLSRAILLQRRLDGLTRDRRVALDALERLAVGVIAVDGNGTLLFANATAERLMRAGLGLVSRQGHLRATDPHKDSDLHRLVRQAALAALGRSTEAGGVLALPRPEGRPLSLLICPLRPEALAIGPSTPAALLFLGDPDANGATPQQALIELYGLTPAEARLMAALVDGERLEDYAERREITIHTARAQLKQVFAKTGCTRQSDMIREALVSPVLRMGRERDGGG